MSKKTMERAIAKHLNGNEAKATVKSAKGGDEQPLIVEVKLRHQHRVKKTFKVAGKPVGSINKIVYSKTFDKTFRISVDDRSRSKRGKKIDLGMGATMTKGQLYNAWNKD